jgi:cystathionine beta-lyase
VFADLETLRRRRSSKWATHPPDVLPVFVAETDVEPAPPTRAALTEAIELGDMGYAEPAGLYEAFAGFAERRFGWAPDTARIRLMPDVMAAIVELLRVLTEPGDGVIVATPAYPPFFDGIPEAGRKVVEVPLAGRELELDRIDAELSGGARALLLASPHNPTGRVLDRATLDAIAEIADRHGALVLSDEIHAPLTLPGAAHTPFAALGDRRAVVITSASKAFNLAGLKCAVAVAGSDEVSAELDRLPEEIGYRAGILGVIASQAAFAQGDAWLDELLAALDANRRLLGELLAEHLPEIGYVPPEASFLAWLDCRALGTPDQAGFAGARGTGGDDPSATFLERGRVALEPGPRFGTPGRGFARLNFGCSPEVLEEAVRRMVSAVRA